MVLIHFISFLSVKLRRAVGMLIVVESLLLVNQNENYIKRENANISAGWSILAN